jgi:hypothetical protein
VSYGRLVGSVLLFALGAWFVITQEAKFTLGGDRDSVWESRRGSSVDAKGLDAVAIGSAVIGLGVVNLALGIRSQRRIPVFWLGTAILGAAALYGIAHVAIDVARIATS